jgi:dehydrogenase/reductase SDR family protein 4
MLFDLTGKVAVITGSTKGIGRSIAEEMAKLGAKVVISSRKEGLCQEVADAIRADGGEAIAVPCHIGRKEDLQNLVDKTLAEWGRIDSLVCNAAINPVFGPLADVSDEAWAKVMDTNVKSAWWLINMAAPQMAERKDGSIILVSSIGGLYGHSKLGLYGVSKAAEMQLARSLAVEWGPHNIRVNTIAPGLIKTDFARALWEDERRRAAVETLTPLRRLGDPVDIGGVAAFLASDAGLYLTGQTLVVDGGRMVAEQGS